MCLHCNYGMQDAMKQILLIKVGQQTLNNVQTEQLWAAHQSLVVWSAIMEPLKGLGQSTSVIQALFWWKGMRKQESVRVMAFGMEAYPSAFQVHTVLNSFHFRSGIYSVCIIWNRLGLYTCTLPSKSKAYMLYCNQLICSTTYMLLAIVVDPLAN